MGKILKARRGLIKGKKNRPLTPGCLKVHVKTNANVRYIATLIESFAVVTSGPELIAGSILILLNKNGKKSPRVVDTIIAENIAMVKAITILICLLNSRV